MQTTAIVFEEPNRVGVRDLAPLSCGPGEILVETLYSCVSPGTEMRVLGGILPHDRVKFPFVPGYAFIGRVLAVGEGVLGWQVGDVCSARNSVGSAEVGSLWGGHVSHHRLDVSGDARPVRLPAGCDPWAYVLTEIGAISWRGVTIAEPDARDVAVVIGQGMIGALAARFLQTFGARVIVVDLLESRLERGRRWGLEALNGGEPDIRERILEATAGGADIVVEASSSLSGVQLARDILRPNDESSCRREYRGHGDFGGRIPRLIFLATYTQELSELPGQWIHAERALIAAPKDRTYADRLAVVHQITLGRVVTDDFVREVTPAQQAPDAYRGLAEAPNRVDGVVFGWQNNGQAKAPEKI
ncbi:MAG: zinc-binding alcohol dehydrogenase [Verrucomicrobiota bacterium JB024]|nr:zinc-binding alcohol dehydrogenase [Verrucomicrobiota bacterium JB024]